MSHQWIIYLLGAVLSTMGSLIGYNRKQGPESKLWKNILDFYFDGPEAGITTVGTVAFVWIFGSIYINKLPIPYTGTIATLPEKDVVAFFLGAIGEYAGPLLLKALIEAVANKIRQWFN